MNRSQPGPGATQKTVLVVEDDASIAMGLDLNLSAEGFRVLTAGDGESGLTLARDSDLDLVILDVMLPRLNGFEVLRTLRAERRLMPVIMLSARGAEMDKVTGLELGAEDYRINIVRIAVARSELIPLTPTLASMAVHEANNAESKA